MESKKWYDRKLLVFTLCVVFFPIGLYGLYKSQTIEKNVKYVIYGIWAFVILAQPFNKKNTTQSTETKSKNISVEDSIAKINELEQKKMQQPTDCYYIARRALIENLNDKDSYQEDSHREYFVEQKNKKDPFIQVIIRYRAKNMYGGMILKETVFNFDESLIMTETYDK